MPIKELPDDLRDDPSLKDFNDLPSLAKSYREQKAFVGGSIRPPGPDAKPEEKKEFRDKLQKHAPDLVQFVEGDADAEGRVWEKLGRPKDEAGYEFATDVQLDMNLLRTVAKNTGMTKAQFAKFAEATAAGMRKQTEASKADQAALKTEWGQGYDQQLKDAAAVAAKLNADEATVKAIAAGTMRSKDLKIWAGIAKSVGKEPGGDLNGGKPNSGGLTPTEADAQFREIQRNPAYFDRNHVDHERLVKKAVELQGMVNPR